VKAEIIAIGTEVLMGEVINTHAAWLSQALAELGIDVHYHVTVGDNPGRMQAALQEAAKRADCILITGGLGPTDDDITVDVLSQCFGDGCVVSDLACVTRMREIFAQRQQPGSMPVSNYRQALRPHTAESLKNPIGTAPGLFWKVSVPPSLALPRQGGGDDQFLDCVMDSKLNIETCIPSPLAGEGSRVGGKNRTVLIFAFPGVPRELYALWPEAKDRLLSYLKSIGEGDSILVSRFLHFFGISESALCERLTDLMQSSQPSLAPYVGKAGIKLRLAAKANTVEEAERIMQPVLTTIQERVSEYFLGVGEKDESLLESGIADILRKKGWTVSLAESCTGGLISHRLTNIPGSSDFIYANLIVYREAEKTRFLGVKTESIEQFSVVSPEVAREMALGLAALTRCDFSLSITGLAGPGGDDHGNKPGLAYVGLAVSDKGGPIDGFEKSEEHSVKTFSVHVNSAYNREDIKYQFSQYALFFLWKALNALN